jgi:hypothetical protein
MLENEAELGDGEAVTLAQHSRARPLLQPAGLEVADLGFEPGNRERLDVLV